MMVMVVMVMVMVIRKTIVVNIYVYILILQADILELADRMIPEQCVLECFIDPFTGIYNLHRLFVSLFELRPPQ